MSFRIVALALLLIPSTAASQGFSETKLTASDAAATDIFGWSVSIHDSTVVVGAPDKDDPASKSGAVYVFERDDGPNGWKEATKLTPSDLAADDGLGASVSMSGDTIVAGGHRAKESWVFERNRGGANSWGESAKLSFSGFLLSSSNPLSGYAGTGEGVSISEDTIVVGANQADSAQGSSTGSAFVFQRNAGGTDNWGQVKILTAPEAASGDQFGGTVSVSGDTVVVGAQFERNVSGGDRAGAAYVFERDAGGTGNWGQVAKLVASDLFTGYEFGNSVSIDGDVIVVGSSDHHGIALAQGVAYIFERDHGGADNWGEVEIITANNGKSIDQFGYSVSVRGDAMDSRMNGVRSGRCHPRALVELALLELGSVSQCRSAQRPLSAVLGATAEQHLSSLTALDRRICTSFRCRFQA